MNITAARSALVHALILGLAADLLLRDGPAGIGFPIWITILALSMLALLWRIDREPRPESQAWLAAAVLFSAGLAWRHSEPLQVLDVLAAGICLAMAAVSLRNPAWMLLQARLRDALWSAAHVARSTAAGVIPVALRARLGAQPLTAGGRDTRSIARAAALTAVLLFIFGLLLLRADPIFASLLSIPAFDIGEAFSHLVVFGFFTWIVGGWTLGAFNEQAIAPVPERFGFALSTLDITMSLGMLNVLFAAFVGAQLAWFFGGETFLQAHTGLTASAYARRGFFELFWVAVLVIPLLLGTRALIGTDAAERRRHTMLSLPLIVMLGAMMLSAVLRMRLYVQYFGLTTDRFYPLAFMAWLAIVLLLLPLTVMRERGRYFLGGAALTWFATLAALNVANPEAIIARANVDRAATKLSSDSAGLDVVYLALLGGDAVETAANAVISPANAGRAERCLAARDLLTRWGPSSRRALRLSAPGAWRMWNAGERRGLAAIGRSSGALRAVVHETCTETPVPNP